MRKTLALFSLSLGIAFVNPVRSVVAQVPILTAPPVPSIPSRVPQPVIIPTTRPRVPQPQPSINPATPVLNPISLSNDCTPMYACLGWDEQLFWGGKGKGKAGDRSALIESIDNSLGYLKNPSAARIYQNYPDKEITLDRVRRSLLRFRDLVRTSKSPADLQAAVRREFTFYKSVGNDGKGTVKFTAYYEPIYEASRVPTSEYKYPIYRLPDNFVNWQKPHPKRLELEGKDGLLGKNGPLSGLEMFWFRDRFDAYLIHIQGSAKLELTDGTVTGVGYANGTDYPWTSIGKELLKDGQITQKQATMPGIVDHFRRNPQSMDDYLPRWERFIFFRDKGNTPATGSIGVPVTPERSIATDKSLMPPGALALINASFPYVGDGGGLEYRKVSRFVLDQDTGSAIKTPGRVDYFMGTGNIAGDRAGVTGGNGTLYYLLLKR
ncbi:murein transglycosylase A [Rivularia sp. UHCC 0363]|uniref:murein transglycosylase A n=1 Tax=Rivularia sp. UHCC 0363 TaxID=3110244 RepID=UPI002B20D009|nr:murein transglycosylase A [Rivularia sp. UHCC 0363]MEA5598652.1 murein transglycosylase A [Rivularia sp. UHCC 0363]